MGNQYSRECANHRHSLNWDSTPVNTTHSSTVTLTMLLCGGTLLYWEVPYLLTQGEKSGVAGRQCLLNLHDMETSSLSSWQGKVGRVRCEWFTCAWCRSCSLSPLFSTRLLLRFFCKMNQHRYTGAVTPMPIYIVVSHAKVYISSSILVPIVWNLIKVRNLLIWLKRIT